MRQKYFMRKELDDDMLLGITHDPVKQQVTVGGSARFADQIMTIVACFGSTSTVVKHPRGHRMKVRTEIGSTTESAWESGLVALRDEQWLLRETRSFRRLMS